MPKKTCGSPWIDALPTRWGFETRLNLIWLQSVQSKIKPANNVDSMTRQKIENFLIDLQKITRVNILTPLHFGCRVFNCGKKYDDYQNPITKKMLHWKNQNRSYKHYTNPIMLTWWWDRKVRISSSTWVNRFMPLHFCCRVLNFGKKYRG